MADTVIMQILQWAIPSGGIGAAIAWVANRKVKEAETAKSVHDTYKVMYEDVSTLLVETQKKYEITSIAHPQFPWQLDETDGEVGKQSVGKRSAKGQRKRRDERDEGVVDGAGEGGHGIAGDSA